MLMFKLEQEEFGIHPVSGSSRTVRLILLAFILGPTVVTGNDIQAPDTVGNVGRFTSLELNAKGNPVVSYHDLTKRDLKLLSCDDPYCEGDESGSISVLDTVGIVGAYTSLALDVKGNPVVSYSDSSEGNLKLLRCDSPDDCASDSTSTSTSIPDSSDNVGRYTSLVLDDAGNPVVSYYDDANGDLKLLHCDDPGCTGDESKNISTPDTTGDVGLYTSLALDDDGNPVISYYAANNGGLKLLHCDDSHCKGNESGNITIPDTGEVGWFTSLVLDAAGNPVVSYFDFANGDLKILHCDDPNCVGNESKNITAPDTAGQVGAYNSMVLDAKGNPVVSYNDASNGDLKILHCDDPKCAGDETNNIATPDATSEVGSFTSLVLDAAGNPVVSYYDFANGDLKILHCSNHTCNSKKR